MDVKGQYRRSFVGPVWLTLNTVIFIGAFSFIGSRIFNSPVASYIVPFACGQIFFVFLSTTINDSAHTFIGAASYVKQLPVPRLSFVLRVVVKNTIIFVHSLPVLFLVLYFWGGGRINFLHLFLGFVAVFFFLVALCAFIGLISARFRDVPMIVSNLINLSYFATPIIWPADMLRGAERYILYGNPFYLMIELLRAPLLGERAGGDVWFAFFAMLSVTLIVGAPVAVKYRRSIPYWV